MAYSSIISTSHLSEKIRQRAARKRSRSARCGGCIYGFLGPNGAGKSTTLKMILGLVRPTAGDIAVFGEPMTRRNRLAILKQVGSLIESPSYYGHLSGEENLRIVQTMRGVPEKNIREVLEIVRLTDAKDKRAAHYSLGMKQRLGLAAALLGYPRLLILDEPTNGLDPAGIQEMRELIKELPQRFGMTVVVSSHLLAEIDQMADHVGIIREGELVFQDSLTALHSRSKHHLALRTTDNLHAQAILRERRLHVSEGEDGYLVLPLLNDDTTAALAELLVTQSIGVLRLEERQKSLEDIFLELTGKGASL